MEDPSPLSRIYFGQVTLTPAVAALRQRLDRCLQAVCAELPLPLVAAAGELLASYGRRAADSPSAEPSFFRHYYSPLWSWIHWATAAERDPDQAVVAGQAMAMFLHLLDDHLCDRQLACSPLLLQLRTAAWLRLENSAALLGADSGEGKALWQGDLARYFSSSQKPPPTADLDGYCAHFRDQMATCVAIPTLALRHMEKPEAADALRQVVFGLGVAWRLIDDVQDAYADWLAGEETILFLLLRNHADFAAARALPTASGGSEQWPRIVEGLLRSGVLKVVLNRCCAELTQAANLATERTWTGLANELLQLRHPVAELVSRLP